MMKRNVPPFNIQKDAKTENTHDMIDANIDLTSTSTKSKPSRPRSSKRKKEMCILSDINHKNNSGENNWQKFLKLNPQTKGLSKPVLKQTNPSLQPHELHLAKSLPIEKSLRSKTGNLGRTNNNDQPGLHANEVNFIPKVKPRQHGNKPVLTKQIAMDCEMVGVEVGVNNSIVARVSLVNAHGDCIYDKYVKPTEPILDYRTQISGIRPKDLESATDFVTVQKEVADILNGRILVGHAVKHDLSVLFLSHPRHARRDTSSFKRFKEGRTPSLKSLAKKYLGVTIQDGEHSSVQDALATMQLYKMFRKEWDAIFFKKKTTNEKAKSKPAPSAQTITNMDS